MDARTHAKMSTSAQLQIFLLQSIATDCRSLTIASGITGERLTVLAVIITEFCSTIGAPDKPVATGGYPAETARSIQTGICVPLVPIIALFTLFRCSIATNRGSLSIAGQVTFVWISVLDTIIAGFGSAIRIPE